MRRLDLVLSALKSPDAGLPPPGGKAGKSGSSGDAGGQADSIPPTAQLKVLRTMQKQVNDRTAALQKDHPDPSKYGATEKSELQDIRKEQQDVIDLLEALATRRRPSK